MQRPFLFENEGQQISAMLHLPDRVSGRAPAVLLCHGFTTVKWTNTVVNETASWFARTLK